MSKKERKDILFNCQYFYPEYVTAASLAFDAAKSLAEAGYSVDTLCGYPKEYYDKGDAPKEEYCGINIKRVRYFNASRKTAVGRLINYLSFFVAMCLRFFSLRNYKVIITYSTPPVLPFLAAMAGKFFGTKHVFVCFDVYPEIAIRSGATKENSIMSRFMRSVNKRVYIRAANVVALSTEMKDFLVKNRDVPEENVVVIPNWHKDLKDQECDSEDGLEKPQNGSKFTVSYLGNMGTCQDMNTIISAMEKLSGDDSIRFVFAGHGNKVDDVIEATQKCGNGTVYGFLQGDEYKRVLAESDCYLVSLEKSIVGLGVPSKTYSYMMMGKPIISIMDDCDINKDLEKYTCGIALKNGDADGLVNAVKELSADRERCKMMGAACRKAFEENYTSDICLKKYSEMIGKVLENT